MRSGVGSGLIPKSFKIRNFRSIGGEPVEIELGKRITILIGLNNSGKSNLIRAMELATDRMNVGYRLPGGGNLPIHLRDDEIEEDTNYLDIILEGVNLELQIDSILDQVISTYYRPDPGIDITDRISKERMNSILQKFVNAIKGNHYTLRRRIRRSQEQEEIGQTSLVIESEEKNTQNAWLNASLNLSMRNRVDYQTFLQLLSDSLSISSSSLPIGIPSEYPSPFIALRRLRDQQLSLDNYRSKIYLLQKDNSEAFEILEEIITSAFPNYESIVPQHNEEDNTSVAYLKAGETQWELGIQGDGIKRMILFFLFLVSEEDTLLLIDEPEMHLHPNLEERVIDYFQKYGKGQLILATHSEIIVNSVPPELLESGDIVINWLWLDENNRTKCTRSSKSDVVEHLKKLGVPTNRYLRHMYAHSSKRVFVEGKNDHKYIKMILEKFKLSDELDKNNIVFIEYEGKYNLHKIDSFLIDAALKAGGGEIESPPISCLFVRDRDESVTKLEETDNLMILSVREIENTVLSESSIRGVVSDNVRNLEIDNFDYQLFEKEFATCIRNYLSKWTFLKLRNSIESMIRPLLRRKAIDRYDRITDEIARTEVNEIQTHIEEALNELKTKHEKIKFENIHTQLGESCFPNETIDYKFICCKLPGKDLINLIKDALFQSIFFNRINSTLSEEYVRGKIGDMCQFDSFLQHTAELPEDIGKFVERIRNL
jgi:predicted ATPase